ncbi:hypothetical protein MAHJHV64_02250 [Mycobacterium avium subsp. hominissuis]
MSKLTVKGAAAPSVTPPGPARAERHAGVTPEPDGHAGVTLAEGQALAEG